MSAVKARPASGLRRFAILVCLMLSATVGAQAETILTLPFENTSNRPEYNWIGETFAIEMGMDDLDIENFKSLNATTGFVLRRNGGPGG